MKRKMKIAAAALCVCFLVTVAYAATAGTSGDPLVTLSYLNGTFKNEVAEMAEQKAEESRDQFQAELDKAIADWDKQIKDAIAQGGSSGEAGDGAVFSVVTLNKGQTLVGDVGCEIMLRIGSAVCAVGDNPGLIDTTDGSTLNSGGTLTANHLYMVTISTRSVTVTSNTAKVLVRGPYTIQ